LFLPTIHACLSRTKKYTVYQAWDFIMAIRLASKVAWAQSYSVTYLVSLQCLQNGFIRYTVTRLEFSPLNHGFRYPNDRNSIFISRSKHECISAYVCHGVRSWRLTDRSPIYEGP
jgi:hypothetical protein